MDDSMTNDKTKKRNLRCTDHQWELITKNAELASMTVNQYIVSKAISSEQPFVLTPEQQMEIFENLGAQKGYPLLMDPDQQRRLRVGVRLIADAALSEYENQNMTIEEIDEMLDKELG